MSSPGTVSWVFKPENTCSGLPPLIQPTPPSTVFPPWSPLAAASTLSPAASLIYSSPTTPSSAAIKQDGTPQGRAGPINSQIRAAAISPQGSVCSNGPAKRMPSHDLLLPLMPSTEDSKLHNTVSGLRFALQQAQLNVANMQQKVRTALLHALQALCVSPCLAWTVCAHFYATHILTRQLHYLVLSSTCMKCNRSLPSSLRICASNSTSTAAATHRKYDAHPSTASYRSRACSRSAQPRTHILLSCSISSTPFKLIRHC